MQTNDDINHQNVNNEVENYRNGRYISTNEAFWRIYSFPLHERYPAVVHLTVHIENGERIYFNNNQDLRDVVANRRKTTLTAYFELCQEDLFARELIYPEVPKYYTWCTTNKEWKRRRQGTPVNG